VTAIRSRRTRRTVAAATVAMGLVIVAAAMFTVGVVTLSNSQEGEAVGIDERPRVDLPATPNALLAVTDEDGELVSVVVATLLPEGQGGSIVTVPVNADATAGFGPQRRSLNESFDPEDLEGLVADVEGMLSISIERVDIVDPDGLEALLAPIDSVQVVLPEAVIDSSQVAVSGTSDSGSVPEDGAAEDPPTEERPAEDPPSEGDPGQDEPVEGDPGLVIGAGPQILGPSEIVEAITAIDDEAPATVQHQIDVAMWSALAQTAPISVPPEPVTTDGDGRPVAPASVGDLFELLWQGDVGVRDIEATEPHDGTNPTEADVVVLNRFDANLVFAQVSPGLVSTPNTGLKTRILAQFTEEQLETSGGTYDTNSDLARQLIGQVLFLQGNVVSVDTIPIGAPAVTTIVVADERSLADAELIAELLLGPAEVRVATTVLEGVDLVVTLGMTYFERSLDERLETNTTATTGTVDQDG